MAVSDSNRAGTFALSRPDASQDVAGLQRGTGRSPIAGMAQRRRGAFHAGHSALPSAFSRRMTARALGQLSPRQTLLMVPMLTPLDSVSWRTVIEPIAAIRLRASCWAQSACESVVVALRPVLGAVEKFSGNGTARH